MNLVHPVTLLTALLAMNAMTGCGSSSVRHPANDVQVGHGVMEVTGEGPQRASSLVLKAIELANTPSTQDQAASLAKDATAQLSSVLATGVEDVSQRAFLLYNLSLAESILGDLNSALHHIDVARGLCPDDVNISSLQASILHQVYRHANVQISADIATKSAELKSEILASRGISDTQHDQLTKGNAEITAKIVTTGNIVNQQTSVLDRALGVYIPIKLPPDLEEKLISLEAVAATEEKWPTSEIDARAFASLVSSTMKTIPPWAEPDLLPRISALRWHVSAFRAINEAQRLPPAEIEALCVTVLDAVYPDAPKPIRDRLEKLLATARTVQADEHRAKIIADAEKAIAGHGDPEEAYAGIDYLVQKEDPRAKELQLALRVTMANKLADAALRDLKRRQKELVAYPPDLQLQALRQLSAQAASLRMAWLEQDVNRKLQAELSAMATTIEASAEELAKKSRDVVLAKYQLFALDAIKSFVIYTNAVDNKTAGFSEANPNRQQALKILSETGVGVEQATYAYGMKRYLLGVDQNLLDPAVGSQFQAQWGKAWEKCSAEEREDIAKASAATTKKGLNNVR